MIGLFLFIREPIALIKTITAFTVSHSITLALSVLELVKLDQGPVEAVIALSIFFWLVSWFKKKVSDHVHTRAALGYLCFWVASWTRVCWRFSRYWLTKGRSMVVASAVQCRHRGGTGRGNTGIGFICFDFVPNRMARFFNQGAAWGMGCLATFWTLDRTVLLFSG